MTWTAHTLPELPPPAGRYSHVVDAGALVWTAGSGPADPATGAIPAGVAAPDRADPRPRRGPRAGELTGVQG